MSILLEASIEPPAPLRCTSRTRWFGSWRCAIWITAANGPLRPGRGVVMRAFMRSGSAYSIDSQPGIQDLSTEGDRKSTRLNSSHVRISYAVFCLKKKNREGQQCD